MGIILGETVLGSIQFHMSITLEFDCIDLAKNL